MRISTNTIFEMGSSKIGELTAGMARTQQQIAANRRVLTPSDDPVAAASALGVNQALAVNDQYTVNRQNAKNSLSEEESLLSSVTSLLQSIKDVVVGAGNGSMNDEQRQAYTTQLRSQLSEMMGLANSRDGSGNYIFGGYQTASQPFTASATGATYSGDQGQRMLQVGAARQLAASDPGSAVFENNTTGNGHFVTSVGAANTGSGIIGTGSVADITQVNGHAYDLAFSVDATTGATTYVVTEITTPATPPGAAQPFVSGQAITVGGMRFDIQGKPANGDTFSVNPSRDQSIFTTINDLLNTLTAATTGPGGQTQLTNGLNAANNNIDNALSNVSAVRSTIGSRLTEIDNLDNVGSSLKIQYTQTLTDLQGIDPVEAYSRFTQQQYTLQAAQQSFIKISGLSLFNLLT